MHPLKLRVWLCGGLCFWFGAGILAGRHAFAAERPRSEYVVKQGDALSLIAVRVGVPLKTLLKVNRLERDDKIRGGQVLALPITYQVVEGDVLGKVAERHGVSLSRLCRDNNISPSDVLNVGQQLLIAGGYSSRQAPTAGASKVATPASLSRRGGAKPSSSGKDTNAGLAKAKARKAAVASPPKRKPEYVVHRVRQGEVLSRIAQRFLVKSSELQQLNKIGKRSLIRVGQSLKIPVTKANRHVTQPDPLPPWKKYALKNFTRGYIKLRAHQRQWQGQAFDKRGKLLASAKRAIHSMLGAWSPNRRVALSPRLIRLVVQVSDEFGGRPIRVVSGYRRFSHARFSKHKVGRALDFSIPGVPNAAVRDFLLTLPSVGVGYYPNSTHVHIDDRSRRMYWVDISRPGKAPRYVHKSRTGKKRPTQERKSVKTKPERIARLGPRGRR